MEPGILVMLVITLIMPGEKPNISHRQSMPSTEECLKEAQRFLDSTPPERLEMSQPKGKTEIDIGFIAAFTEAYKEANKTGEIVKLKDYPGWRVHPRKDPHELEL